MNYADVLPKKNAVTIKKVVLGKGLLCIDEFTAVARYGAKVEFSPEYRENIKKSRMLVEKFLNENRRIYGVTTGFGYNVNKVISPKDAEKLQLNIVRSHACSVGEPLEKEVVRAIQLMMLINIGRGYSGVSIELVELLAALLNNEIVPYAPGEGSVGYLGVEAHMTLVLIGEGKAWYKGELLEGSEALKRAGLKPIRLKCKEGLALLNGTTSVTAMAVLAVYDAVQCAKTSDIAAAIAMEVLRGTTKACDPRLHSVKLHKEQQNSAANILSMLKDSEIAEKYRDSKVQDPYILRCIPQMHGASKRTILDALVSIFEEMNSCSDNPIIYPIKDDGIALMGGNFDGSYVGIYADSLCIAIATLAKFSERRTDRVVNRHFSGFPDFLVASPGLNNGYMIPQYTAAGLLGEIKVLSHPSTADSIPTSANQEDPVSLAYFASKKAYSVVKKYEYILAIEFMAMLQALDFVTDLKPSTSTRAVYDLIRREVPTVVEDRFFYPDIESIKEKIHSGDIVKVVEDITGRLEF